MTAALSRKRVLLISYLFPPTGGVGVLRSTSFVKYLPDFGWDVTVLTVENPSVPLRDPSLLKDIPENTLIRRARTLEPSYATKRLLARGEEQRNTKLNRLGAACKLVARSAVNLLLQPDPSILWYPAAVREGSRILAQRRHDAIMVSAPPFSSLLVAASLARKFGAPLVLDYRDEWTINHAYFENRQQDKLSRWTQRMLEDRVLRAAHLVIATTPGSASALEQRARACGSRAECGWVYNGFDPDDFPSADSNAGRKDYGNGTGRFRISFVGTLWKLTSIEPFVAALKLLASQEPALLKRLEIVIAGRQVASERDQLQILRKLPCQVVDAGFLDHAEALHLMQTSDCLLQLLSDLPHVERVVASKIFEYMAARRPVLAISGPGDHWDIVSQMPNAALYSPQDIEGIAAEVSSRLLLAETGQPVPVRETADLSRFHRRHLTAELAAALDQIVQHTRFAPSEAEAALAQPLVEEPS